MIIGTIGKTYMRIHKDVRGIIDEVNEKTDKTGTFYNVIKILFLNKKEVPREVKAEVVNRLVKPIVTWKLVTMSKRENRNPAKDSWKKQNGQN